jgi:glycosyltransferase involved in cell wall biosynthesis
MPPKISIVMACFNAEKFIAESIESILNQSFADFELILIDDGSTDGTPGIIKRFRDAYRRILVLEKENTGPADSRNRGVELARGAWIAILDSDDLAQPNRLELQYACAEADAAAVMIGSGFSEIDEGGRTIKCHRYPGSHAALLQRLRGCRAFPPHSSLMYRADTLKGAGGFNKRFISSEDWDLWLRMAERGTLRCLEPALVKIRKHAANVSNHGGGKTQILYGLVASTCHFLRARGAADPSCCADEAQWHSFVDWIELRLREQGFFARQQEWSRMRAAYFSANNKITGAWCLVSAFASSGLPLQKLKHKLFGSALPAALADAWIKTR